MQPSLTGAFVRLSFMIAKTTTASMPNTVGNGGVDGAMLDAIMTKGVGRMGAFIAESMMNGKSGKNKTSVGDTTVPTSQPQ